MADVEEVVEVLLHGTTFGGVVAGHVVSLFEQIVDEGRLLVYFLLIPSLLEVVLSVVVAIGIAEGYVANVF